MICFLLLLVAFVVGVWLGARNASRLKGLWAIWFPPKPPADPLGPGNG